ncbi:MAG: hypothetical protein HKP10_09310 [Kiritimatiellales bacterium]|nr:hypothetical protein [Kiritimatiellales bacterium]
MTKSQATENRSNALLHSKKSKNCAGATFVEALIALAIFAVFTTGSFKVLVARRNIMDMSRDRYIASNIAKNRLELVRTFDFDQIPQLAESPVRIDNSGIPAAEGKFLRETDITTLNTNLLQLAISVKILNRRNLTFDGPEEVLNTYVSKHL